MRNSLDDVWCILGMAAGAAPEGTGRKSCGGVGTRWSVKRRRCRVGSGEVEREVGNCSSKSLSNGGVKGVVLSLASFDRLLEEFEERKVAAVLYAAGCERVDIVDKLARALEVFWAKAANERRFRREIEPTTEPVKEVEGFTGESVEADRGVVVLVVVVVLERDARKRLVKGRELVESGTNVGSGQGRDSSR